MLSTPPAQDENAHRRALIFLNVAAFAGGFCVMGAEMATGRLVAPYLGTSTPVWSALIGTVMGALALGAMLGGRLSKKASSAPRFFVAIAFAGVLLALTPMLTRPLMRGSIEALMRGGATHLALAAFVVLLAVAVPTILLGALGPILLQCAAERVEGVGSIVGRLNAFGTVGSLVGTLLSGIVWIPTYGTESAFRMFGAIAVVLGIVGWAMFRKKPTHPVAMGAPLALLLLELFRVPSAAIHDRASVFEKETPYNYLRVVDSGDRRYLHLNEGFAQHTVMNLNGKPYFDGPWGHYVAAAGLPTHAPSRILIVGLGGGSTASYFASRLPNATVVGVELDPGVVDVARRYFNLPKSVEVHTGDARTFLAGESREFDLIVIDAFQFPYTPFQLTTQEFFRDVKRHLAPGGAMAMNVGRMNRNLDIVYAIASTLGTVFPHVNGTDANSGTNTVLVATDHPLTESIGVASIGLPPSESASLLPPAGFTPRTIPARFRMILTDDRAPIELLTNRIIYREFRRMVLGEDVSGELG